MWTFISVEKNVKYKFIFFVKKVQDPFPSVEPTKYSFLNYVIFKTCLSPKNKFLKTFCIIFFAQKIQIIMEDSRYSCVRKRILKCNKRAAYYLKISREID